MITESNTYHILQDSLVITGESVPVSAVEARSDSNTTSSVSGSAPGTSIVSSTPPQAAVQTADYSPRQRVATSSERIKLVAANTANHQESEDSVRKELQTHFPPIGLYRAREDKFSYKPYKGWKGQHSVIQEKNPVFHKKNDIRTQYNWTLGIGLISILLILYLNIYYKKFVTKVINTIVNFQLADTMLREKNSVVRRAFFFMNMNYVLIFSLFLLLLAKHYGISQYHNGFLDYLLILGLVILVLLARFVLYYLVGFIFNWTDAVSSQLHIYYLINKNVGLFFLPLVFIAIYTSPAYSGIMLILGVSIFVLSTVFKLVRGFQIIIRNGVLIFYAILYLCTLELIPIVLGSKLIFLLR